MTADVVDRTRQRVESGAVRRTARTVWGGTRQFRPVLILLVTLVIVLTALNDTFLTRINLENIATSVSILWLVAMGATLVQLSGGIDLSSGAIAAICGICLAKLLGTTLPAGVTVVAVVAFGALVGAVVNGLPIGLLRLNVFVVTLASMTALTGVVNLWSDTQSFYVSSPVVDRLATARLLGLPTPVWIMVGVLLLFLFLQSRTYFGRDVYAIGGNPVAARLSGIRPVRTVVIVYAIAGGMAALGGIIAVGRIGAAAPQPDNTLPLNAIAAVLLGGTALTGGSGGVLGTALGVLLIGTLQNGLSISGVPTFWQQIVTGVILVVAVLGDRLHLPSGRWRRNTEASGGHAADPVQPASSQRRTSAESAPSAGGGRS